MPTLSSLSQYAFHNLGPLTTPWTPPSSCTTATLNIALAQPSNPTRPYLAESCEIMKRGDCFPSGSQVDAILAAESDSPLQGYDIFYFSPAAGCPRDWATAGVAVKDSGGVVVNSSGVFAPTPVTGAAGGVDAPVFNPMPNVFMEGLGPGETAVVCCPQDYEVDALGGCYKTLPVAAYTASTGCRRVIKGEYAAIVEATFTWNGVAVTGAEVKVTATSVPPVEFLTTTLGAGQVSDFVGLNIVPMMTLVQAAENVAPNPTNKITQPMQAPGLGGMEFDKGYAFRVMFIIAVAALAGVILVTRRRF